VTTRFPPYQFSVDSKRFPHIPEIMNLIDNGLKVNRSKIICEALTEWYQKRRHLFETNYANDKDRYHEELLLKFESVLPSIAEPLSEFRYESNRIMYHYMTSELLNHTERISLLLADGVNKTRERLKGGFDSPERKKMDHDRITESLQKEEFPTEEARIEAFKEALEDDKAGDEYDIRKHIVKRAQMPQKTAKQRREERIRELQEELQRLTKQEQYEKHQKQSSPLPHEQQQEQQHLIGNNK
jgi:hypothetical protein